jgi:hypothetical protein
VAEDPGEFAAVREHPSEGTRRREVATVENDLVPVAADAQGDDATADGTHGTEDRRRLVYGVRDEEAAAPEPPMDEPVPFVEQPGGLPDRSRRANEQVLDDQVEAARVAAQKLEGVFDHDLDAQRVEAEVPAGHLDDLPVEFDADDRGIRRQRSNRSGHAGGREAEEEDAPGTIPG